MKKALKLIELYYLVCDKYTKTLQYEVQRFSLNSHTGFITDEELITIYLFSIRYERRFELKLIYDYVKDHWSSWFPNLPSYQSFNTRLNRISDLFPSLVFELLHDLPALPNDLIQLLIGDSMPIVTCKGNRNGKVAPHLTAKGYCSTKKMHYYGVKLHSLVYRIPKCLPSPNTIFITPANVHDLTAMRDVLENLYGIPVILDKAYCDQSLSEEMNNNDSELVTLIKNRKGLSQQLKNFDRAFIDLYNTSVSKLRQPIESFFNWINEKTNIQVASKVRSESGLIVHIYGKIAAALLILINY